jgi:hypothetical protein
VCFFLLLRVIADCESGSVHPHYDLIAIPFRIFLKTKIEGVEIAAKGKFGARILRIYL